MATPIGPTPSASAKNSAICAGVMVALMLAMRKLSVYKPELLFIGGLFGSVFYFFVLVFWTSFMELRRRGTQFGWITIAGTLLFAVIVSFLIHPVCATVCLVFSIPVVIYIKWAYAKLASESKKK